MKPVYKHILGYLFLTNLIQAKESTKKQKHTLKVSLIVDDSVSSTNSDKKRKNPEFTTVEHCQIINNVADCPDSYFQLKNNVYTGPGDDHLDMLESFQASNPEILENLVLTTKMNDDYENDIFTDENMAEKFCQEIEDERTGMILKEVGSELSHDIRLKIQKEIGNEVRKEIAEIRKEMAEITKELEAMQCSECKDTLTGTLEIEVRKISKQDVAEKDTLYSPDWVVGRLKEHINFVDKRKSEILKLGF